MTNSDDYINRVNRVLHLIHRDIAADLSAERLACAAAWSESHFHRRFRQVTGESVHGYIRRTRLEQAANQLMFNPDRPVIDIAEQCGFQSLSSFGRAFRQTWQMSPGRWRQQARQRGPAPYLDDAEIAQSFERIARRSLPVPELIEFPSQAVAYVRHRGYGRSIRLAWQMLQHWAQQQGHASDRQIGLHHSNPTLVPLAECRYVACLAIEDSIPRRGAISSMRIPGGLHAVFTLEGRYGELLPWLSRVQQEWLPDSGLRARTIPAHVRYERNQFLDSEECFELELCLPVTLG